MGVVPFPIPVYEILEEIALSVQHSLADESLPFCAFNGGADVFVDVGNKLLGLYALQKFLGLSPPQVRLVVISLYSCIFKLRPKFCPIRPQII